MGYGSARLVCIGMLIFSSSTAQAQQQASRTKALAEQWRASRLADLATELAGIDAERARVTSEIAAVPLAPPVAPAADMQTIGASSTASKPVSAPAVPDQTTASNSAAPPDANGTKSKTASTGSESAPGRQNFGGLDLGIGLSFTADVGKEDRISRASVVNGIVRTDDQDNGRARIMLETHYFFTPCTWDFLSILRNPCTVETDAEGRAFRVADPGKTRWGLGPFVAVQPGSDNIIDAIALGVMVGARRPNSSESFNFGVGIVLDPNTRLLGEGLEANKPLPVGESEIRYRETLQTGILVLTSFSF
jgi:hypothetical protein